MSRSEDKRDPQLDRWLAHWSVPDKAPEQWDRQAEELLEKLEPRASGPGQEDWLAPPFPAQVDEPSNGTDRSASGEPTMTDLDSTKPKRASLKDIARRVSAAPPAPAATPASSTPSVPPPTRESIRPSLLRKEAESVNEDSGVLDLAAVRQSMQAPAPEPKAPSSPPPAQAEPVAEAKAEAKPAAAPAPSKKSVWPFVLGVPLAAAAVVAVMFLAKHKGEDGAKSAAEAVPAAQNTAVAAAQASAVAAPGAAQPGTEGLNPDSLNVAQANGAAAATAAPQTGRVAVAAADGPKPADKAEEPAKKDEAPAAPPPPPPGNDLSGAMAGAVGATGGAAAPVKGSPDKGETNNGSIPESPSQGAIQGAIGSVMGAAKGCVAGMEEPSRANITFGSDGRVRSVSVSGAAAGTAAEGCIKSALMKARVGPFQRDSFNVGATIRP